MNIKQWYNSLDSSVQIIISILLVIIIGCLLFYWGYQIGEHIYDATH